MTQPPHWQSTDHSSQPSYQYGPPPQHGQPQFAPQPADVAPSYPQPQFYGPGPYPPPHPPKRSHRGLILAIIGVLVIVGGAVAAVLMLTSGNNDKKHTAGMGGVHDSRPAEPARPTGFPSTDVAQRQSATGLNCMSIKKVLTGGAFQAGAIKVSDGGTVPSAAPQPTGTATTRCTVSPRSPGDAGSGYSVVVVAWSGVTEHDFAAQLTNAGYHSSAKVGYTLWINAGDAAEPRVVTATIANQLVTLYLA